MLGSAGSVCLDACPDTTAVTTYSNATCVKGITPTALTIASFISNGSCGAYRYKSNSAYSICVPDVSTITSSMIALSPSNGNTTSSLNPSNLLNSAVGSSVQIMSDLQQTWPVLAAAAGASLILSFLWLFIIQWFGTLFVWAILLVFNGVFISGSIWLYFYWKGVATIAVDSTLSIDNYEVTAAFAAFIVVAIIAGIFLLVTIAMIKKIALAVQILKEATYAVRAMPLIGILIFILIL